MKAIQVDGENLIWADFERPTCGAGNLRIEVAASAINRADLMQRNGGYPPPLVPAPLWDWSARVPSQSLVKGFQVSLLAMKCALCSQAVVTRRRLWFPRAGVTGTQGSVSC